MKLSKLLLLLSPLLVLLPQCVLAQSLPEQLRGLHGVLTTLHDDMMPRCAELITYGRAIASFAATFYIGHRVWKHIANAEPIDFYPLLRPFVLGGLLLMFPEVIFLIRGVLKPALVGTEKMKQESDNSIKKLIAKREAAIKNSTGYLMYGINDGKGDRDAWMLYTNKDEVGKEGLFGSIGNDISFAMDKAYYNMKAWFKEFVAFVLQLLYEAAALCINTISTFNLIICAMLGPLVFGLAVFDGFQHSLTVWLARYINYYLWVPIANIMGAVLGMLQEGMIKIDIAQVQTYGDSFFTTADVGYMVFMVIGIVSYTTIPSIAAIVINPGMGSTLTSKVSAMTNQYGIGIPMALGGAGVAAAAGGVGMAADALGNANLMLTKGHGGHGAASGYFQDKLKS